MGLSQRLNCSLKDATIVREDGVTIRIIPGDHGPPHAHVQGGGDETRIGQNGKPIGNDPELSSKQEAVVRANIATIRKEIGKAMKAFANNRLSA